MERWVCGQILTPAQQSIPLSPQRWQWPALWPARLASLLLLLLREKCAIVFNDTSSFVRASTCWKNIYLCNYAMFLQIKVTPTDTFLGKVMQRWLLYFWHHCKCKYWSQRLGRPNISRSNSMYHSSCIIFTFLFAYSCSFPLPGCRHVIMSE